MALGVHLDRPGDEAAPLALGPAAGRHARPPKVGPDPGDELPHGERLRHVVVGADLESGYLVRLGILGGEDDDRDLRFAPDDPAQVEPVDVGQHEVEDDEGRRPLPEEVEAPEAVDRRQGVEALPLELVADGADQGFLVLHDEDGAGRGRSVPGCAVGGINRHSSP